jgi:hypothetical protein
MKKQFGGVGIWAARYAAAVALLCSSQVSWGQDEATAAPAAERAGFEIGMQSDETFEQYASTARLAAAWRELDSVGMTDAALQFAEGERVLLRSHHAIKASQVLELAIRVATEKGDKDSLGRLAKSLERSGEKERLALVTLAMKTAGTARAADPDLISSDPEAILAIRAVKEQVLSARVAGDKGQLAAVEMSLGDMPLSETQRAALTREIAEGADSVGDTDDSTAAVQVLDEMSGVNRISIVEVAPPEGQAFVDPNYPEKLELSEAEIAEYIKIANTPVQSPAVSPPMLDGSLALLDRPSRNGFAYSASWFPVSKTAQGAKYYASKTLQKTTTKGPRTVGDRIGVWQYTNDETNGNSCGQAAAATALTYYSPTAFKPRTDSSLTRTLVDSWNWRPDVGFGIGGTSPKRMESMLRDNGLQCAWIDKARIQDYVRSGYLVICMLDIHPDKGGWLNSSGFHWVCVYGVDGNGYYVTNWRTRSETNCGWPVSYASFNRGIDSWAQQATFVANKGLLVWR